jgi:hypothetical protein
MKRLTIREGIVLGLVVGLTLALLWLLNGGSAAVQAQGPGPEIAVSPVFFDETLAWEEERTRTLTVANEGTGDLSFAVDVLQIVPSLLLHLDEAAGATMFYDSSGNNHHGSCTGDSCPTAGVGGQWGTAVRFDGIDDHIAVPHNVSLNAIENMDRVTIAAWFNITDWYYGWFSLVDKYKLAWDFGWTVQLVDTGGVQFVARPGTTGGDIWCDFTPNLDEWYHLAVSYDRSEGQIRFYVNGEPWCESSFSSDIVDTEDGPLYIGYNPSGGDEYSNGTVDELVLYDRALSAEEIQALYSWNLVGGDAVP